MGRRPALRVDDDSLTKGAHNTDALVRDACCHSQSRHCH